MTVDVYEELRREALARIDGTGIDPENQLGAHLASSRGSSRRPEWLHYIAWARISSSISALDETC